MKSYAVVQRLRLIDFLLEHYGCINRQQGMDYFGISMPQASRDIQDYLAMAPLNAVYDKSQKCYFATSAFKRVYP